MHFKKKKNKFKITQTKNKEQKRKAMAGTRAGIVAKRRTKIRGRKLKLKRINVKLEDIIKIPESSTIEFIQSNNIKISLIAPAIRPHLWMEIYNSLKDNYVSFEIVFCGHIEPDFELPNNFKYIYSRVKPAQCLEIARRRATGDFIMFTGDDICFHKHFLDNMIETFLKANNKTIVSAILCRDGTEGAEYRREVIDKHIGYRFWDTYQIKAAGIDPEDVPRVAWCAFIKSSVLDDIGGIDKNFIFVQMHVDVIMRILEIGGQVKLSENSWAVERKILPRLTHNVKENQQGQDLLYKMWVKNLKDLGNFNPNKFYPAIYNNQIISKSRLIPFEPFENKNILIKSQGPKGRWI